MKRFGYTLAEALVALAIVGVVAAITLPMANKFMPDGNKALYLSSYDSLVEAVQQIAVNSTLYPLSDGSFEYTNAPLANTQEVEIDGKTYSGATKFGKILASMYGEENPTEINEEISFTAKNGVQFRVNTETSLNNNVVSYKSTVNIDINGEKGKNSFFSETCSEPDRYIFEVGPDGKVIASDIKGQEYLATRTNTRKLKEDVAKTIREKLNIKEMMHLSTSDTEITLASISIPEEEPSNDEPNPVGPPINPVTPIVPVEPDPVTPIEPINPIRPTSHTCANCGLMYFPANGLCNCSSCGAPILCTTELDK